MKQTILLLVAAFVFTGCSTFDFGGSAESSATYVSKSSDAAVSAKSASSSSAQSKIDMKVEEIKSRQDSELVNKYIRKGF